jgi:hypothetical protein
VSTLAVEPDESVLAVEPESADIPELASAVEPDESGDELGVGNGPGFAVVSEPEAVMFVVVEVVSEIVAGVEVGSVVTVTAAAP